MVLIALLGSCNDEWTEELYTQMISFKAPLNSEGVSPVYLRYEGGGEREFDLPVIVSGSKDNDRDIVVRIGVDNDTLGTLNQERFQYRTDLYFKQLGAEFYELQSPSCLVPAGSSTANYRVKFKFNNLDMVERWVLPLTILDDPAYQANNRKGWKKALLHIIPFNDYSGNYSATSMNVYFDGDNKNMVMSTRTAWVVDEQTVFFYAGMVEERAEDRADYKIIMHFGDPVAQEDGSVRGPISLYAENQEIAFEVIGQPTYHIRQSPDLRLPYLVREYCTVDMQYKYNDITSIPSQPIRYRAQGSMTMERQRNTLIPDEDQAIMW